MRKQYKFNYDFDKAEARFEVDTNVFTAEHATATLEFFTWDYDEEADPVEFDIEDLEVTITNLQVDLL